MKLSCPKLSRKNFLLSGSFCHYGKIPDFGGAEKPETKEKPEDKEKPGQTGVPIDAENLAAEKQRQAQAAKRRAEEQKRIEEEKRKAEEKRKKEQELSKYEQKIEQQFEKKGEKCQFYKLDAVPGLEGKGLKSEVQINMPDLADKKYLDEKGQKKQPKVIVLKRAPGSASDDSNPENAKMLEYVEQMRKNGEPVVLIMQNETPGADHSKELDDPETVKKIIEHAEKLTGASLTKNVALSTIGGPKKIEEVISDLEKTGETPDYGLNWPSRNPDLAMTGSQFNEALRQCQTPEEKRRLILSQALAGAFSPDSMKPKIYTTTVNGKEVKIPLYGMVRFGVPGDETIVSMDGEMSQTIADILGGNLPTSEFYGHLYNDPNVKKAPFWYGTRIQDKAANYPGGALPFEIKQGDKTIVNGTAMQSAPYARAESEMYFNWLQENGIKPDDFTIGHRKTVFMPDTPNPTKIIFGGGIHASPGRDSQESLNRKAQSGDFVQGVGDHAHEPGWYDYAQGTDLIGDTIIDGNPVKLSEVLSNPDYADIRKALFSAQARGPECRYQVPDWAREEISEYQRKHPQSGPRPYIAPTEIAAAGRPSAAPTEEAAPQAPSGSYGPSAAPAQQTSYAPAPSYAPSYQSESQPQPPEPAPASETPQEQIEIKPTGKVFVIGDSLSHGFVPQLKGMDVTHVHPELGPNATEAQKKEPSVGQLTSTMVHTFEKMTKSHDCRGATLVIIGGSNDLFGRDPQNPLSIEKTQENLTKIYKMAKAAGMKVIASTLPPLAYSSYSKKWGATWAEKHSNLKSAEDFENELIQKWTALNDWIKKQAGTPEGPDEVIQTHQVFQDQNTPGKLRPDLVGTSKTDYGVHLTNYAEFGNLLKEGIAKVQPQTTEEPQSTT